MVISLFKGRVRTKLQKTFDMWSEKTRILNKVITIINLSLLLLF
jgi:hypothetical protein